MQSRRRKLLKDLKQRGLLDTTLVVWGGEFGRTPEAQGGKGRDHNNTGFTMWMAGGGVRGGTVTGATDATICTNRPAAAANSSSKPAIRSAPARSWSAVGAQSAAQAEDWAATWRQSADRASTTRTTRTACLGCMSPRSLTRLIRVSDGVKVPDAANTHVTMTLGTQCFTRSATLKID